MEGSYLKPAADNQYYFDEDLCTIVLSNTESLDQYRFGNGIAAILHHRQVPVSSRPEEIFLPSRRSSRAVCAPLAK